VTSDQERLGQYVDIWADAVDQVLELLRSLAPEDWDRPTDLPGWDVRAVAAHLAHLESDLAGMAQTAVDVPELDHVRSPMSRYTEQGRIARADWSPDRIVEELAKAAEIRLAVLRENPPTDATADPDRTPGGIGWDWETLLRNRPLDVWMHEQDIRRAVGRPGGLTTPAAAHTTQVFTMSLPYAVGKKVAPPAGTTVVVDVRGVHPVHLAVEMGEDGRARPTSGDPQQPTVSLGMDLETFVVLAGGRRPPSQVEVAVSGDSELGARVLEAMAVTP
jgi:uncharacterized protein (TIGR03083 family)